MLSIEAQMAVTIRIFLTMSRIMKPVCLFTTSSYNKNIFSTMSKMMKIPGLWTKNPTGIQTSSEEASVRSVTDNVSFTPTCQTS